MLLEERESPVRKPWMALKGNPVEGKSLCVEATGWVDCCIKEARERA